MTTQGEDTLLSTQSALNTSNTPSQAPLPVPAPQTPVVQAPAVVTSTPALASNKLEPKTPTASLSKPAEPIGQQKTPTLPTNGIANKPVNNQNNAKTDSQAQKPAQSQKHQINNFPNQNKLNRANSAGNLQNGAKNPQNKAQQHHKQNQNKMGDHGNKHHQNKYQSGYHQNGVNTSSSGYSQDKAAHHQQQQQLFQQQQQVQVEKKFTGRCRLFVGNLPSDITEQEFKDLFTKYGETGECFLNTQRSFGFIKLDTRINAEHAKQDLDGFTLKGRCIRVRFASHGAAVRVKNLSPYVSNEYLEQAFSLFGPVERAVVIVDDKGRPTGEGIVEFERKPAASQCINRCAENCFILTSYPKPVIVEPLDQKDDEDGLPEKSIIKNQQFHSEREISPHFAQNNSLELDLALKWRDLYELENRIKEEGKKKIQEARDQLEYEIEVRLIDYKELKLKEDLRAKQEELQRIEDMRKNEFQRRKDMEIRRQDDERRRQDEMIMYRKQQQDNMMMHQQQPNQRIPTVNSSNGNGPVAAQNAFDQPLLNQPHMAPGVMSGSNGPQHGNNRRYDQGGSGSGGQYSQQQAAMSQQLNQLPQQQQAMLAAQLSAFAMAAAGNLNMPGVMFDQQQQQGPNMGNNSQGQGRNRDGNDRRNFNRRGGSNVGHGRGQHANRDDPSPFPGYDTKRARY